jgi:hypothetical protein
MWDGRSKSIYCCDVSGIPDPSHPNILPLHLRVKGCQNPRRPSAATMPDLVSLPTEILSHIFDDLYSHTPKIFWPDVPLDLGAVTESDCGYRAAYDTLAAFARSCRTLNSVATEALYKRCISPFRGHEAAFTSEAELTNTARRDTKYIEILPGYTSDRFTPWDDKQQK